MNTTIYSDVLAYSKDSIIYFIMFFSPNNYILSDINIKYKV